MTGLVLVAISDLLVIVAALRATRWAIRRKRRALVGLAFGNVTADMVGEYDAETRRRARALADTLQQRAREAA